MKVKRLYKKILTLTGVTLLSLFLVACGNSETTAQGRDTLNIDVGAEVPTLDPHLVTDTTSSRVVNDLFEGLTGENQKNEPVPGVARSWDISSDGKTYTFHLRDDAKWSNGQPVTAEDFVFSLQRVVTPATAAGNNNMLGVITNANDIMRGNKDPDTLAVKAIDAHTLQITLDHPSSYFLQVTANSVAMPVYPPLVKANPKSWAQAGTMISNGPYELKKWIPNGYILAEKNPYYWNADNVKIAKVRYLPIVNKMSAFNQYNSGQVDITSSLPNGLTETQFAKKYGSEFIDVPELGTYYFWFNVDVPILDKLEVRKALTMSIDRQAITDSVLRMGQTPLYGIVPNMMSSGIFKDIYKELPEYDWVELSQEQRNKVAIKLLEKVGYSAQNPLVVTLKFNTDQGHQQVAQAMTQMWHNAFGSLIQTHLLNEEWKVFLQSVDKRDYIIARQGWIADFTDPATFVELYLTHNPMNHGGFSNEKLDAFYDAAMLSSSIEEYNRLMKEAMVEAMNNYYTLPVYNYTYFKLVKPYVGGYDPSQNYLDHVYSKWFYFK